MTIPRRSISSNHRLPARRQAAPRSSKPQPRSSPKIARRRLQFSWAETISRREWAIYLSAIQALRASGIRFLLGGGFALAAYTGRWRDTKDIDFYVSYADRAAAIRALTRAGFADYYSRLPYDRKWIHRNFRSNMIVDVIWAMANQRARVDEQWFRRAGTFSIRGEALAVVPIEEMIWCKLYIMQRDHCDWTDIFNLLYARGTEIDWEYLLKRLEDDRPLLSALLTVYGWLCPAQARRLTIWKRLGLRRPASFPPRFSRDRMRLLDSRAWFAAREPQKKKLEV